MSELVANCPRCGAEKMTFDLIQENYLFTRYSWQQWFEAFCVCRHCKKSSIFVLSQNLDSDKKAVHTNGLVKLSGAVNRYMDIEGIISLKDKVLKQPPAYLPHDLENIFKEGCTCLSVDCFNAAGTMFRLCVDLATLALLPVEETAGLNTKVRRDLGLRIPWLFDNNKIPETLKELSTCIKEDGNDGAHRGSLSKEDAEDLLDFTYELLERLYTDPERLKLANERRKERRSK